jgi:hypothetical protein
VCSSDLEFYCSPRCYDAYSISDGKEKPPFLSKWKIRKKKEAKDPLIRVRQKTRAKTKDLLKQRSLKKRPCVVCQSQNVLPHHENYADPFNVIWLCEQHHTAYHDGKITLLNGKLQWNPEKLIPKGYQGEFPKKKYRTGESGHTQTAPNNRMHLTAALRLRRAGVQSQRGALFNESMEPPSAGGR